ncbi:hypothetical protein CWI37_0159p0020 [Hamiltosporidium tvaerminnensis]|uniref:Uncharacterized protein n=1 Tax=Hamiltosporidium tvaerminnensis TaxID=1176355 RepID=A0A4Q9LBP7_9MICR|nr:hypothetical protein LUQ84_001649 [Hamiltosporidium tvaerminnensis]TBU04280.1 hypothetical protein CWI37_0159p0020 [Hamiltosporidium tvaerminnensis]
MTDQDITYSTIEHDYMQLKDTFDNHKFAYIEKLTKQYFIEGLCSKDYEKNNIISMVSSSKIQLREVKGLVEEQEELIKSISIEIYELEKKNKEYEIELNELSIKEEEYEKRYLEFNEKLGNVKIMDELCNKVKQKNDEITETMEIIENKNENLKKMDVTKLETDLYDLQIRKEELCEQERNLSRIFYDDSLVEMYEWYLNGLQFLNKLFFCRIEEIKIKENNLTEIYFGIGNLSVVACIEDRKFIGAKAFYLERNQDLFDSLVNECVFINDLRLFMCKLPFIISKEK